MNVNFQFPKKGYGRVFVKNEDDRQKVIAAIKQIDPNEVSYFNEEIVSVLETGQVPELTYLHKFEGSVPKLECWCWDNNIPVWIIVANEYCVPEIEKGGKVRVRLEGLERPNHEVQ